ncbi:uncharacterized protein [Halyomorpha halys]|uniref:uncharacterized protein n=1 Tax=Halyomorpha halys TaxID=286706 RepID=UPI0034D34F90
MPINKSMTPVEELRTVALPTIAERYPEPEWIHIYTDRSATGANKNAASAGAKATNFAGENLTDANEKKIILLSDSRAALLTIASELPSANAGILTCRKTMESRREILALVMQWITAHCGIHRNEEAVRLPLLGVSQPQPLLPISMDMVKEMARSAIAKRAEERSRGECGDAN